MSDIMFNGGDGDEFCYSSSESGV